MSVYPKTNEHDSSIFSNGITEGDWSRLHSRVIPNSIDFEEFKEIVSGGKLQDRYLAKDIHKIMQEMRDILLEHGELREAASFPVTGRKADLSRAAAAAVRVLNRDRLRPFPPALNPLPLINRPDTPSPLLASSTLVEGGGEEDVNTNNFTDEEARVITESCRASCNNESRHSRPPPIVDHITDFPDSVPPVSVAAHSTAGAAPESSVLSPTSAQAVKPLQTAPAPSALSYPSDRILVTPVLTRLPGVLSKGPNPAVSTFGRRPDGPGGISTAPAPRAGPTELEQLNDRASPFSTLVWVLRRFSLRYGSHSVRFEVPVPYAEGVATRRLRVQLLPFRHPHHPSRWPVAKEVALFVNDQGVHAAWRRGWPERKPEVAKTFLALDLTQYIHRSQTSQHLRVEVFNKDYFTPALLAVVRPNALEEIVESFLEKSFGEGRIARLREHLTAAAASSDVVVSKKVRSMLAQCNQRAAALYHRILCDDGDEALTMGDPVISTKCPISQMPIEVPVRGALCRHLQCVDLRSHLLSGHKSCYWNCPLCDGEMMYKDLVVDTLLWRRLCEMGDPLPPHVRLSLRKDPCPLGSSEVPALVTADYDYCWYPSNPEAGGTGVGSSLLLADDADEIDQEADQDAPQTRKVSLKREASASQETSLGSKRFRTLSPSPTPLEGTAENPIEL